jgi:acetate kinase
MHILVINPGSSSIKFSVFNGDAGGVRSLAEGEVGGIGGRAAKLEFRDAYGKDLSATLGEIKTATMEDATECGGISRGTPGAEAAWASAADA